MIINDELEHENYLTTHIIQTKYVLTQHYCITQLFVYIWEVGKSAHSKILFQINSE